jgi:two-component system cell cycle sensor histidine kinase/response regulator CckA
MKKKETNRVLLRQLKRLSLSSEQAPTAEKWLEVINFISSVYDQNEEDRYLQERALSISSREMREALQREKDLSSQLAQASRLSSIGTLASGVAHELNNPLGAVRGYSELMLEESQLSPEDKTRIERIVALTERMSSTIKHLLKLARKPEESMDANVNLATVVKDSLELFSSQMKYESIKVEVNLPPDGPEVVGDPHRLISVVQNLVNNARDEFLRADQTKLTNPLIQIGIDDSKSDSKYLCLTVKDNAGGIPKEIFDRIFDPFFTTKEVGQGTGLGLSLSRRIVEELGGTLTASTGDGNTEFFILLKRNQAVPETVASISSSAAKLTFARLPGTKQSLLLVDDEDDMLTVLNQKLKHFFDVTKTNSALEAVTILSSQKFDFLVTDLKMPNLSGDALIELARKSQPDIGVVLVSGHAAAELSKDKLVQTGVVLISKPLPNQEALIQLILSAQNAKKITGAA